MIICWGHHDLSRSLPARRILASQGVHHVAGYSGGLRVENGVEFIEEPTTDTRAWHGSLGDVPARWASDLSRVGVRYYWPVLKHQPGRVTT